MKKENCSQVNLKNQEVSKMSTANIPYNNKQLLKWSCFRIEKFEDTSNPKKSFELVLTPLTELVKQDGYEQFKDKLNWLYNNYSKENYQLVWSELQDYNERRKIKFIQDNLIARADYILNKQIEEWKLHFGEIPTWIEKLTDNQRQLLLDRALTCYGLKPEEVELNTKTLYTVPERLIKDYTEDGTAIYWSQEELNKAHIDTFTYTDVVGKFKVYTDTLKRLAEDAIIRDARWMSQFNNTEFDLREHREVENDETHNKMVPITDMQGPDSPYGIQVEFRDFLEPIYAEDEGR